MSAKSEIKYRLDGAPPGPCIIGYTSFGTASAFPEGAMMGIVNDPSVTHPMQRMILIKIHREHLIFKCTCNPGCTVQYRYNLDEKGRHE